MNNYTEQIDQYLNNSMNSQERLEFELELKTNEFLKKEFEVQKNIMEGLNRAGIRHEFSKAIKHQILIKGLVKISAVILAVCAAITLVYFITSNTAKQNQADVIRDSDSSGIQAESFDIRTDADTVLETKGGIVFAIPEGAFKTGKKNIKIEIKEALIPSDIIKQGLSTTNNGELLQTAGMFYINAYDNGKELELIKSIHASIPSDSIHPKMMLFDGQIDKDGNINWVNPRKIEKKLRTYDIRTLDFYPEKYIPTLKALALNYKYKKYTDSLYYSFSGNWASHAVQPEIELETIGRTSYEIDMVAGKSIGSVYPFIDPDANKQMPAEKVSDSLGRAEIPANDYNQEMEIDPSRIKAIWHTKFNKTILATREFEERLRFIHTTCTPSFLDFYIHNLNKPLYVIDSLCAGSTSGAFKEKFLEFYKRKDGGVSVSDRLQDKLSKYFADKYLVYKEATEKTWQKYENELNRLNAIADSKRRAYETMDFTRNNKVFNEEYCLNVVDAYRQIGEKRECPVKPSPAKAYYEVELQSTGWKNLDQYVFEATSSRESLDYVTETGRKASITYSPITVNVIGIETYDRVLAYLIPDALSSFQRMLRKDKIFTEKLNALLKYDVIIVAFKGNQAYLSKQVKVVSGAYSLSLLPISEVELKNSLDHYKKSKGRIFESEMTYRLFEQKEQVRQVGLQKEVKQREQIAKSIFPCYLNSVPPAPHGTDPLQAK